MNAENPYPDQSGPATASATKAAPLSDPARSIPEGVVRQPAAPEARPVVASAAPDPAYFDLERADRLTLGRMDFLRALLDQFFETFEAGFAEMQGDLAAQRYESLASNAHRLKGSAGAVAAMACTQLCNDIELACLEGRTDETPSLMRRLAAAFDQTKVEVTKAGLH